jgi:hypothetical protein
MCSSQYFYLDCSELALQSILPVHKSRPFFKPLRHKHLFSNDLKIGVINCWHHALMTHRWNVFELSLFSLVRQTASVFKNHSVILNDSSVQGMWCFIDNLSSKWFCVALCICDRRYRNLGKDVSAIFESLLCCQVSNNLSATTPSVNKICIFDPRFTKLYHLSKLF